jgi:hypothetical protein
MHKRGQSRTACYKQSRELTFKPESMKKLIFEHFELLSENAESQLVSGFSEAFEGDMTQMGGVVNGSCPNTNCAGGNCVAGCGSPPPPAALESL